MNIFVLDKNPRLSAAYHCDKHVVKMCVEYAQILSTVLVNRGCDSTFYYRPAHVHHPCVVWTNANIRNFYYLYSLLTWTGHEYENRYGKIHSSVTKIIGAPPNDPAYAFGVSVEAAQNIRDIFLKGQMVPNDPPPLCMPDIIRNGVRKATWEQAVQAYRTYYSTCKRSFAKWNHSNQPEWWI